jgi:hypothetical protein
MTMDVRSNSESADMAQAIQQTFAQGGVKLELIPGDGKQILTKYRARQHENELSGLCKIEAEGAVPSASVRD